MCKDTCFFLFLYWNICCGYSLEVPQWGTFNEYPQHIFLWRNKKNINTLWFKNEKKKKKKRVSNLEQWKQIIVSVNMGSPDDRMNAHADLGLNSLV